MFSDEAHFDLGGYVKKKNCRRTHTLKSRRTQNEFLFGADFGPETKLGHFYFDNKQRGQWRSLSGHVEKNFCSQKFKRRILATFGFNRTTLRAIQPKLHSMFYALFFKIALSVSELMSFGHLGAAI